MADDTSPSGPVHTVVAALVTNADGTKVQRYEIGEGDSPDAAAADGRRRIREECPDAAIDWIPRPLSVARRTRRLRLPWWCCFGWRRASLVCLLDAALRCTVRPVCRLHDRLITTAYEPTKEDGCPS